MSTFFKEPTQLDPASPLRFVRDDEREVAEAAVSFKKSILYMLRRLSPSRHPGLDPGSRGRCSAPSAYHAPSIKTSEQHPDFSARMSVWGAKQTPCSALSRRFLALRIILRRGWLELCACSGPRSLRGWADDGADGFQQPFVKVLFMAQHQIDFQHLENIAQRTRCAVFSGHNDIFKARRSGGGGLRSRFGFTRADLSVHIGGLPDRSAFICHQIFPKNATEGCILLCEKSHIKGNRNKSTGMARKGGGVLSSGARSALLQTQKSSASLLSKRAPLLSILGVVYLKPNVGVPAWRMHCSIMSIFMRSGSGNWS